MPIPIQGQNRQEIRHSIGRNLGICIVGEATSTVDTSSLIDAIHLRGGDDEHNEKQVMIYDATGSIVDGEKSFVSDYAGSTSDATCSPVFSANIADGDKFEMWDTPWFIDDINDVINQVIMEMTKDCLKEKQTTNNYTAASTYEYDWLSSFVGLFKVEYVDNVGVDHQLHSCDAVWDELVDADVTASLETGLYKEGSGSLKLVAAAGLGAGDIMATEDISSIDISECDTIEIWIYSSVALSAGDLQVLLDNTAQCASAVESLNIPATTANTWTRHLISLANPYLDTAIISVGIKQVSDKGAFTLYVDDIRAVKATSRIYKELNPRYWEIVRNGTNYLKFTQQGLDVVGSPIQIRLTGYQIPALLSDDTTDADIDPEWIINQATGRLLIGHAKSSRLDIEDKAGKAKYYLGLAEKKKASIRSEIHDDSRWL